MLFSNHLHLCENNCILCLYALCKGSAHCTVNACDKLKGKHETSYYCNPYRTKGGFYQNPLKIVISMEKKKKLQSLFFLRTVL